ncbi:MAG: GAF domain-containing SpoIIE family protein phosphatase [bacterium]
MNKNINKKYNFTQLDEKLFELQALFDLSKALNSSLNLKSILDTILLTPMGKMLISKGMVLISKNSKGFVIETLKGLPKDLVGHSIQIDEFPTIPQYMAKLSPTPWKAFLKKHSIELVIPILHDEKKLGIIGFGKKILGDEYSESELEYLHSLSNIAATAVQNGLIFQELKDVNRQLDRKVQELNTLFEIGKELNSTLETDKILNLLSYSIMGEMVVNRCLVFLENNGTMTLTLNKGLNHEEELKIVNETNFLQNLMDLDRPYIVTENNENKFFAQLADMDIAAVIPMRIQNKTKGVIALGEKITKIDFLNEELNFLTTLGNLSMISLENARLFEETLEKQRLEEELLIAREIQRQLLPNSCPDIKNFEIAALNISSRQVGGDYYDCIKINEYKYGVCIADVSGKGTPAALLMANLQASLHALANIGLEIDEMTNRINNLIYQNTGFDKFITFFYGILDTKEKKFTSVNAGHNPPYLFHKDGSFRNLEEGGLILGMMPNISYKSESVKLKSGDCLIMFTDGVSEAMNAKEEEFEEKRIEACVLENFQLSAEDILQKIITSVKQFTSGQPQTDDITLLTMKVL